MDMKSGVIVWEGNIDGQSSMIVNLMLPSWSVLTQLGAHQEDTPGNHLVVPNLQIMDKYSAPVGSCSCGYLIIGDHITGRI